jgi:hypothetical protein
VFELIQASDSGVLPAGALAMAFGVISIIIYLITIALGIGCFTAWSWVWPVGVIFTIIELVQGIVDLFLIGATVLIGIAIYGIIILYLFQPQVKKYFGRS